MVGPGKFHSKTALQIGVVMDQVAAASYGDSAEQRLSAAIRANPMLNRAAEQANQITPCKNLRQLSANQRTSPVGAAGLC